ncbi:uncharacterized protein IAS62_002146 [Cryptococcus decagattii]|uniref:Uncharacterized protein n=1 Tax=Cryptococcus decagattii TaxID=1859122 RepID=A0ABZ2AQR2_9TREE
MHASESGGPNRASPFTCVLILIALSSWEDENDSDVRGMYSSALRAYPRSHSSHQTFLLSQPHPPSQIGPKELELELKSRKLLLYRKPSATIHWPSPWPAFVLAANFVPITRVLDERDAPDGLGFHQVNRGPKLFVAPSTSPVV